MQRKKQFLLLLSLFLINSNSVYASCTKEEIDNFKKIEDQYKVTYEFDISSKTYTLTFYEAQPNNYIHSIINNNDNITVEPKYLEINETTYQYKNVLPGTYEIIVSAVTETCDEELKNTTLKLAKYNKYYEDDLCKGIEEFVLCQPTYEKKLDYDTFVSRVNTYKKTLIKDEKKENDNVNKKDIIITYIKDNATLLISALVFIIVLTITLMMTIKSIRKSRRLE